MLTLIKAKLYKYHYDCIKEKYGYKINLLLTSTDSLTYETKPCNVFEDFYR